MNRIGKYIKKEAKKNKFINNQIIKWKEREKKVSYGNENPDKTFFVIRRNAPNAGLYSFVLTNLGWMKYALDKGYIPVVDMQSLPNTYLTEGQVGRVNAWEYYFRQPAGYSLEDIARSRHVILSSINAPRELPLPGVEENPAVLQRWQSFSEKYLVYSDAVQLEINRYCEKLLKNKKTLGVLCRGTDYTGKRPAQHPVQPTAEEVIRKAREVMARYGCTQLYLATEDAAIYRKFKAAFDGTMVALEGRRFENTGSQNINELSDKMESHSGNAAERHYRKGLDYAVTIGVLAACDCLVAGRVSGTYGALLSPHHFEYIYLFNKGLYE